MSRNGIDYCQGQEKIIACNFFPLPACPRVAISQRLMSRTPWNKQPLLNIVFYLNIKHIWFFFVLNILWQFRIKSESQDHQLSWWHGLTALLSVAAQRKRLVKFRLQLDCYKLPLKGLFYLLPFAGSPVNGSIISRIVSCSQL